MEKLYTLYDKVAQSYCPPSHFVNDGIAKRNVAELMTFDGYRHCRDDYELYCIGEFDSKTGIITAYNDKVLICKGSDFAYDN